MLLEALDAEDFGADRFFPLGRSDDYGVGGVHFEFRVSGTLSVTASGTDCHSGNFKSSLPKTDPSISSSSASLCAPSCKEASGYRRVGALPLFAHLSPIRALECDAGRLPAETELACYMLARPSTSIVLLWTCELSASCLASSGDNSSAGTLDPSLASRVPVAQVTTILNNFAAGRFQQHMEMTR
jgi:hypothetical protein